LPAAFLWTCAPAHDDRGSGPPAAFTPRCLAMATTRRHECLDALLYFFRAALKCSRASLGTCCETVRNSSASARSAMVPSRLCKRPLGNEVV
jgi:hypothetical protein